VHPTADIRRYLDAALGPEDEARLRLHLRSCPACQTYFDEQQRLLRALAGAPGQPTRAEDRRMLEAALRAIGTERVRERPPRLERAVSWLAEPRRLGAVGAVALAAANTVPTRAEISLFMDDPLSSRSLMTGKNALSASITPPAAPWLTA